MTQLGIGVAALNHDSSFRAAYEKGLNKSQYWIYTLEDSINLIARLPVLAARIYRNIYHPDKPLPPIDTDLDFVGEGEKKFPSFRSTYGFIRFRKLCAAPWVWREQRFNGIPASLHGATCRPRRWKCISSHSP